MRITFNAAKNTQDIGTLGLVFELAKASDWAIILIAEGTRKDHDGHRFQALGFMGDLLHIQTRER